jgi:hypothetical protein
MRSQVSGSVSLDLSGLAGAVLETVQPALNSIQQEMARMSSLVSSTLLSDQETVAVIRRALISSMGEERPEHLPLAGYLAEYLRGAGYGLVAANTGPAEQPAAVATVPEPVPTFWDDGS